MPFEGPEGQEFDDFEHCVETLQDSGLTEEEAKETCGRWQADDEGEGNYIVVNAVDPTETTTKRQSFQRSFGGRWRDVRGRNREWIQGLGALDERGIQSRYRDFFNTIATNTVLDPKTDNAMRRGQHWTGQHVRMAYQKGLELARRDLRTFDVPDEHIQESVRYSREEHREELEGEYEKVYFKTEENVAWARGEVMDSLRYALDNNRSRSWFVEETNATIRGSVRNRFNAQANTAVVRSVNKALLMAFELIGVEEVGFAVEASPGDNPIRDNYVRYRPRVNAAGEVEWQTAGDDKVCSDCEALEGEVLAISDIRETPSVEPPIHPNCRCRLIPTEMELKTTGERIGVPSVFS